ncbi:hypothetical protein H9P43_001439 [Blastocladiella emersonii ATCC 22665]|nr:hypothetical protein H9P43_001439 [Blastocladiella emersonii ATCC 22665]
MDPPPHPTDAHAATFPPLPMVRSVQYFSEVPAACRTEPCILGVDEAGRGPVLGPMVYAVCYLPKPSEQILRDMAVDDSKVLNEEQRATRFAKIASAAMGNGAALPSLGDLALDSQDEEAITSEPQLGFAYNALSPQDLSEWMLQRSKYNLNAIAHDTTMSLIQSLVDRGVNLEHVYVDTVGPPDSYQRKLKARFPKIGFTVAKKADSLYATVSAASIVAKVVRDHVLSRWEFVESALTEEIDTTWGSGYPSDPNTVAWLKRTLDPVFGWPGVIRFSWSTTENLLKNDVVVDDWPAERAEKEAAGSAGMAKFLKRNADGERIGADASSSGDKAPALYESFKVTPVRSTRSADGGSISLASLFE